MYHTSTFEVVDLKEKLRVNSEQLEFVEECLLFLVHQSEAALRTPVH
jgi:hypothetical protein